MHVCHNCMHIIADRIRHFQIMIATVIYYILCDSAQGMPRCWISGEAGLGQYTGEDNPSMLKNAASFCCSDMHHGFCYSDMHHGHAQSVSFCYLDMHHGTPKVGLA